MGDRAERDDGRRSAGDGTSRPVALLLGQLAALLGQAGLARARLAGEQHALDCGIGECPSEQVELVAAADHRPLDSHRGLCHVAAYPVSTSLRAEPVPVDPLMAPFPCPDRRSTAMA